MVDVRGTHDAGDVVAGGVVHDDDAIGAYGLPVKGLEERLDGLGAAEGRDDDRVHRRGTGAAPLTLGAPQRLTTAARATFVYDRDLAHVHDAGFTQVAEAAARMVLDESDPGVVIDLGCGGGALCEVLAEAGYQVHGIDVSPAMVALARRRVPQGHFEVADVTAVALPPCDVVTAIGEVLCYACPDDASLEGLLERIHEALRPGGLLLFDVATTGRAKEPTQRSARGKGWRVEATAVESDGVLTRTIDTWRTAPDGERHSREIHRLRLFEVDDVLARLRDAGFEAEPLAGYDDYGFQHGWDAFMARPRAD